MGADPGIPPIIIVLIVFAAIVTCISVAAVSIILYCCICKKKRRNPKKKKAMMRKQEQNAKNLNAQKNLRPVQYPLLQPAQSTLPQVQLQRRPMDGPSTSRIIVNKKPVQRIEGLMKMEKDEQAMLTAYKPLKEGEYKDEENVKTPTTEPEGSTTSRRNKKPTELRQEDHTQREKEEQAMLNTCLSEYKPLEGEYKDGEHVKIFYQRASLERDFMPRSDNIKQELREKKHQLLMEYKQKVKSAKAKGKKGEYGTPSKSDTSTNGKSVEVTISSKN